MREATGLDAFEQLRLAGLFYADKTRHLYRLASSEEQHFLSRPPKFGKTVLSNSLEAVLRGRKRLFSGLWIDGSDYQWRPRPVVSLSLDGINATSVADLKGYLTILLNLAGEDYDLELREKSPGQALVSLIRGLSESVGRKVGVLIDGYDAPILGNLLKPALAKELSGFMGGFLEALASAKRWLGPSLVTGTLRLADAFSPSGLGGFRDLTFDEQYADICGFTAEEAEGLFADNPDSSQNALWQRGGIESFYQRVTLPEVAEGEGILGRVKAFYGGYSWDGRTRLLSPDLTHVASTEAVNLGYWLAANAVRPETLKPVARLVTSNWQIHEVARTAGPLALEDNIIDLGDISPAALFFQAGFLTVDSVDETGGSSKLRLRYPNPKIELEMFKAAFSCCQMGKWREASRTQGKAMAKVLADHKATRLQIEFCHLFKLCPDLRPMRGKGYMQALFLMALAAAGQSFDSAGPPGDEVFFALLNPEQRQGLVIKTGYASDILNVRWPGLRPMSLRLSYEGRDEQMMKAAKKALEQIEEMKSLICFKDEPMEIYKCGLAFSDLCKTMPVFEKADHWRLVRKGPGRYGVE
jgi:hypothetical protein